MKHLNDILKESLLDDDLIGNTDESIIDSIKLFLNENYKGSYNISKTPNKDGKYVVDCPSRIEIKNHNITQLTNGLFEFGFVKGNFNCSSCKSLTTLKGAPKEVGGNFYCSICESLLSLEGAPKEVSGNFYCSNCESLTSLEGAPKEVGGNFSCVFCKSLTSLQGAPKKIGGYFDCSFCESLTSLEGAPKKVGGIFKCYDCKTQFTKEDIKKITNVKGEIQY